LPIQKYDKSRAEKENRKQIITPQRNNTQSSKSQNQERAPKQKRPTQNRSAFSQNARPLVFGKQECRMANQNTATNICANPDSPAKKRKLVHVAKTLGEPLDDPVDHSLGYRGIGGLSRFGKAIGQNVDAFLEDRKTRNNERGNHDQEQGTHKVVHGAWSNDKNHDDRGDNNKHRRN